MLIWHAESVAVLQHHHVSHGECEPHGEWQWHGLAEREQHPQCQRDCELHQLPHADAQRVQHSVSILLSLSDCHSVRVRHAVAVLEQLHHAVCLCLYLCHSLRHWHAVTVSQLLAVL